MPTKKILLTGYYGFGNLGDDLLFICNYNLLKRLYPGSDIDILTESADPGYLNNLVNANLIFVKSNSSGLYDLIWHGGGGVFFDFKEGSKSSLLYNKFIRFIGPRNFSRIWKLVKRVLKKPIIEFKERVGMGIGVGTFTTSSDKFKYKIQQLSSFNHLIVRDEESSWNAKKLCPDLKISLATDIVFDTDLWMPENVERKEKTQVETVGIILRDWINTSSYDYLDDVLDQLELLKNKFKIQCYSFDAATDKKYVTSFNARGLNVNIWQPQSIQLSDYLNELAAVDFIITSRFHGAIIGACLGIPGICLNIEPKLQSAVEMVKGFYTLQNLPISEIKLDKYRDSTDINNIDASILANKKLLQKSYMNF